VSDTERWLRNWLEIAAEQAVERVRWANHWQNKVLPQSRLVIGRGAHADSLETATDHGYYGA
jgi:hypothetical protein